MIKPPPSANELLAGTQLIAGLGKSTVLPDMDFETYSPAGFVWNEDKGKYVSPRGSSKKGLSAIGAAKYAEHPDTEVLSLAYNLKDGKGNFIWLPNSAMLPLDLCDHVFNGGLLEAWNSSFEFWIWSKVCVPKYGFPILRIEQLRDAMAKSRAHSLPGSLDRAGEILNTQNKKDKQGKRLLNKFSIPRNPTKNDPRHRIKLYEDIKDGELLLQYNVKDISTESEISSRVPDLSDSELEFWLIDQKINHRGVCIDRESVNNCIHVIEQAYAKYNIELKNLTNGQVCFASEIQKLKSWLVKQGIFVKSLDSDSSNDLLSREDLSNVVRRTLQIREFLGSASVKKLYALYNQMTSESRVHDLFIFHSARTGRSAGAGPQPQNLPNSGPKTVKCVQCEKHFISEYGCPWCGNSNSSTLPSKWKPAAAVDALEIISLKNLELVELYFGSALPVISGCLRALFVAKPGHDLICSDYSAIEAVVLAMLAGEEWRINVFKTHGKIYEMSASTITGVDFDEFALHKSQTGEHHPLRGTVGKVAELASGYGGWIGAWKQFGAEEFFNDEEIKNAILAWRRASPMIVEFWGGQQRRWKKEYFGLEGMAIFAVLNPGTKFTYRAISYLMHGDVLYCELPSGRHITYHKPRLSPSDRREGTLSLSYEGWNTNPKNGQTGWIRMNTYGGKLTENVVQAVARDILVHAIVNLEKAGYPIVLHVHDEIVAEVPEDSGSIEEFERIMSTTPAWAQDWPIKVSDGWRGKRYGK
jgi:DNA polymerase